jgi:hypothetical protein
MTQNAAFGHYRVLGISKLCGVIYGKATVHYPLSRKLLLWRWPEIKETANSKTANTHPRKPTRYLSNKIFVLWIKVKLPLRLIKHHAMKTYGEMEV